jgi:hypothetical protein
MGGIVTSHIRAGRWEGLLAGPDQAPDAEVVHLDQPLPDVSVAAAEGGGWRIGVPIPAALLNDGVQVFLVRDRRTGERLGSFTLVTGVPPDEDFRAEIELLRAELEMLKRAFRRHCLETGG